MAGENGELGAAPDCLSEVAVDAHGFLRVEVVLDQLGDAGEDRAVQMKFASPRALSFGKALPFALPSINGINNSSPAPEPK